jgi:hypothetical protein
MLNKCKLGRRIRACPVLFGDRNLSRVAYADAGLTEPSAIIVSF